MASAVLLGCDYLPNGVPGVGKEAVLQLLLAWGHRWNALSILDRWIRERFQAKLDDGDCRICRDDTSRHCEECSDFVEEVDRHKATCRCEVLRANKKLGKAEVAVKKK